MHISESRRKPLATHFVTCKKSVITGTCQGCLNAIRKYLHLVQVEAFRNGGLVMDPRITGPDDGETMPPRTANTAPGFDPPIAFEPPPTYGRPRFEPPPPYRPMVRKKAPVAGLRNGRRVIFASATAALAAGDDPVAVRPHTGGKRGSTDRTCRRGCGTGGARGVKTRCPSKRGNYTPPNTLRERGSHD